MAEGSDRYGWPSSPQMTECRGCSELRKQVYDLSMLMSSSFQKGKEDDGRCHSTFISERKQVEIDKMLMDARHKAEMFKEDLEKALEKNCRLKKQLEEKDSEVEVLKQQNTVYAADFQLERGDRERSQSRVIDLEQQLATAEQRIAELEGDRRHSSHVHHPLPSYNSVYPLQPREHHSRTSPRFSGSGGLDVCDSRSMADSDHGHADVIKFGAVR